MRIKHVVFQFIDYLIIVKSDGPCSVNPKKIAMGIANPSDLITMGSRLLFICPFSKHS